MIQKASNQKSESQENLILNARVPEDSSISRYGDFEISAFGENSLKLNAFGDNIFKKQRLRRKFIKTTPLANFH